MWSREKENKNDRQKRKAQINIMINPISIDTDFYTFPITDLQISGLLDNHKDIPVYDVQLK